MAKLYSSLDTKLIHAGEIRPRPHGAVSLPIFQSSTFEFGGEKTYHDVKYIRLNNTPNHDALHNKLALLENAEAALVTSSGMAAITTTLLTLLQTGDHLLIQDNLYGGTHSFIVEDLPRLGIEVDFIDSSNPDSWAEKLRPRTRGIYVEAISNPLVQVCDVAAVVRFAREHQLVSMIDNTFTSPVNFRPPELGFDLSLHSATKYINGHTDIVAGAVIGRADLVEAIRHKLNHLGGTLDPHACFLLHRGLKTMALRVARQNENALKIARFLDTNTQVRRVYYPGLEGHPQHAIAQEFFDGYGGMLSFSVSEDSVAADAFMNALNIPICAPSLGGVESLVTRPASTSHAGIAPDVRRELGIEDGLIRMSVGIEDADELIADLEQALGHL